LEEADDWITRFLQRQLQRTPREPSGIVPLHISNVGVPVLDQDRARTFYEHTLGFAVVNDRTVEGFRWVSVLPPGGSCALGLVKVAAASSWTGISLVTTDIRAL
jgi:hypothetical protein